jgi:hypothetical protein
LETLLNSKNRFSTAASDRTLSKCGQGPPTAREAGFYDILFIGETGDGCSLRVSVKGVRDLATV